MAGIDSGARRGRRTLDHALPLVPFIDFLLCLVMFLLVTAAWSEWARLEAGARGGSSDVVDGAARSLELDMRGSKVFVLRFKEGSTVVLTREVPRAPEEDREGETRFPALREALTGPTSWPLAPARPTRAVLFTANATAFSEISAVLDALSAPSGLAPAGVPRFAVAFATD